MVLGALQGNATNAMEGPRGHFELEGNNIIADDVAAAAPMNAQHNAAALLEGGEAETNGSN